MEETRAIPSGTREQALQTVFVRKHWFEILLVVAVLAVHLYAATADAYYLPTNWFTRDDAYYYFKVAENITEGRGVTFDGVSPTNGYHPLWMLVNVPIFALARFDLILPLRVLLLLEGALSAGTALLVYRVVKETVSHPLAVLAGTWWAFDLTIHSVMYELGLETALASFAVALLIYRLCRFERAWRQAPPALGQIAGMAAFALLALFSRLDLVFLALLAGIWIILRGTSLRVLAPLDMLLTAVCVFAALIYRLGVMDYYAYGSTALAMVLLSVIIRLVIYFFAGLYDPPRARALWENLVRVALAVTAATLAVAILMLALSPLLGTLPRLALLYDWILNLLGLAAIRILAYIFSRRTDQATAGALDVLKQKWQGWLREAVVYYAVLGFPLAAYMALNKLFIGAAMPVSGEIKRWWGMPGSRAYGGPANSPLEFWGLNLGGEFNAWNPLTGGLDSLSQKIAAWRGLYRNDGVYIGLLIAVCVLWLLVLLIDRHRAVRVSVHTALPLLLAASVVQVLSYNATGYASMKEWYWITEPLFLVLGFALAAGILVRLFRKVPVLSLLGWILVAALSLPLAWNFARTTVQRMPHGSENPGPPYLDNVRFLEQHTPPGAMIGMTGGGNVGYYISDRIIVNMDGLINSPAYFEALKAGHANDYLRRIGLDYIFANPEILARTPYQGQFATGAVIGRYGGKALMEFSP